MSDEGGLWLSAVVPMGSPERGWSALPLVAGLAVCESLAPFGVPSLRLRWPNDVLYESRKLAGLLVDCYRPGLAVVGIGMNVGNDPEGADPNLAGTTVRLADLVRDVPSLSDLAGILLGSIGRVIQEMEASGIAPLAARMNRWWETGLEVELEVDHEKERGFFEGVDPEGRLRIRFADGAKRSYAGHQVTRLRDFEGEIRT